MIAMKARYWLDSKPISDQRSCGDIAGCYPLDADRFAIIIGDVAGRGPAAGIAATAIQTFTLETIGERLDVRDTLDRIDRYFTHMVKCDAVPIASLFLAVVDGKNAVLEYASAGHEPSLHFTTPTRHEHLDPTGPLLGISGSPCAAFSQRRVRTTSESVLVLMTDGITEARHYAAGEPQFFGSTGVTRAFIAARRSQSDPARAINEAALAHAGVLRDDATALVVGLR